MDKEQNSLGGGYLIIFGLLLIITPEDDHTLLKENLFDFRIE